MAKWKEVAGTSAQKGDSMCLAIQSDDHLVV